MGFLRDVCREIKYIFTYSKSSSPGLDDYFTEDSYVDMDFKDAGVKLEDIKGKKFRGCTFTKFNFEYCNFINTKFTHCIFTRVNFDKCDMSRVKMENCKLHDTEITNKGIDESAYDQSD